MIEQRTHMTVSSRPYRWPWHGVFSPKETALLVCTGDTPDAPMPEIEVRVAVLARELRSRGGAVIALPAGGTTPALDDSLIDCTVERPRHGGFTGTALEIVLRRLRCNDLLIAGMPFEIGADCTMRQANDLGFECLLIEDCCTGVSADTFAAAVSSVQMSGGIFGAVAAAADVAELLARASSDD